MKRKRLGEILVEADILTPEQLEEALRIQAQERQFLGEILVRNGWSSEEQICRAVSEALHIEYVHIDGAQISRNILQLVPQRIVTERMALPLFTQDNTLYLAMENPLDITTIRQIEEESGLQIRPLVALPSQLRETIQRHYDLDSYIGERAERVKKEPVPITLTKNGQKLDTLLKLILINGLKAGAEAVHIEPFAQHVFIRFRANRTMEKKMTLPGWLYAALRDRIKALAGLAQGDPEAAQIGAFSVNYAQAKRSLEVSTLPTPNGENIVIHLPEIEQPKAVAPAEQAAPAIPKEPVRDWTNARIVAADDDGDIRGLVGSLLATAGYTMIPAVDGEDALQKVREERPELVILDVVMPKRDGFAVCEALRSSVDTMFTPVMMLTAQDSIEEKLRGLRLGADDYITKPFNAQELLARIEIVLRRTYQHGESSMTSAEKPKFP